MFNFHHNKTSIVSSVMRISSIYKPVVMFIVLSSLLFAAVSLVSAQETDQQTTPQRKLALLVAISKYDRGDSKSFYDLETQADVEELKKVLIEKFQFEEKDILTLTTPEETTKQSILGAFRKHLIEQVSRGDIVIFHYSGHGDQMLDDNGDELDGLDEAFVPSDYISTEDQSNHIRDDELANLLKELKAKQPANITVFLDSCYSGTATRANPYNGRLRVRGRGWQGKPPQVKTRSKPEATSPLLETEGGYAGGYTLISATRPDQKAKEEKFEEGFTMGIFSYHLVKTLRTASPNTTYRDLFEQLNYAMTINSRDQNPQLEGEIDSRILDGTAIPQTRYIRVQKVRGDIVTLEAGALHGVTKGSKYGLYKAGTHDFTKSENLLVEVEVETVRPTFSRARILPDYIGKFTDEELGAARAVETEHHYGDNRLKVTIHDSLLRPNPSLPAEPLQSMLERLPVVDFQPKNESEGKANWDVRVKFDFDSKKYILERLDGSVITEFAEVDVNNTADALKKIRRALEGEARWQMVKKLENVQPDETVKIDLKLVKVQVEEDEEGVKWIKDIEDIEEHSEGGESILKVGDHVMIELRNSGASDCYVTVLDLQPDSKIGPIWPHPKASRYVHENKTSADGKWHRIPEPFIFKIEPPLGMEVFKAIATREPTDFSPLLDEETLRSGTRGQGADSPLGQLLMQAVTNRRSKIAGRISPSSWSTDSVTFEIRQ